MRSSPIKIDEKREQLLYYGADQKWPLVRRRHSHALWLVATKKECDSDSSAQVVHELGDASPVWILANLHALSSSFASRLLHVACSIYSYQILVMKILFGCQVTLCGEPPPRNPFLFKPLLALISQFMECLCVLITWEVGQFCTYVGANSMSQKPCLFSSVEPYQVAKEVANCINMANDEFNFVSLSLAIGSPFPDKEASTFKCLCQIFGGKIVDYMMVVFARDDNLGRGNCLDDSCDSIFPKILWSILYMCGNRVIAFDSHYGQQVMLGGEPPP